MKISIPRFGDASIETKLQMINLATVGLALFLIFVFMLTWEFFVYRMNLRDNLTAQAKMIGTNSASAVVFRDREAAAETLSALRASPAIVRARIYLPDAGLFADYERASGPERFPIFDRLKRTGWIDFDARLEIQEDILFKDEKIGRLALQADLADLYRTFFGYAAIVQAAALISLALAWLLLRRLQAAIVTPLSRLTELTIRVSEYRDYSLRSPIEAGDEFGALARCINEMLEQIQRRDDSLRDELLERERAEQELRVAATTFETQEGILVTDANNIIIRVNQAFSRLTGYNPEETIGNTPALLKSGRHDAGFYREMWESVNENRYWEGMLWNRRKNGEIFPEWLNITAVAAPDGRVTHYVGVFSDMTDRMKATEQIRALAFYDPLTQLPNRRLLLERLQHLMAQRGEEYHALFFIDLDNFKTLNDTKGHDMGDLLLIEVASRLKACVREGDTVARLGGDEFVVLLENLSALPEQAMVQAEMVGEKIREALNWPYLMRDYEYHGSSSVGVSLFYSWEMTADELFKRADTAMYQAKQSGRNALRFFDPLMQAALEARAELEADLRRALTQEQFVPYFQPQVDASGRMFGAEVLLRWRHPERGLVSPAQFIPLTEETGLIIPIGKRILETVCNILKRWEKSPESRALSLAVNISQRQFRQPGFAEQVRNALSLSEADPSRLKLELTESLVIDNVEEAIGKMWALRDIGVGFSMDDFGTGYSSLLYLKRLPLNQLKIDQSFVRDLASDPNDRVIVQTIVGMALNLGLQVIAEGVETDEQRALLEELGCTAFQGYLFGRPMPLADFERLSKAA
jgi:diguanylate cyclase (GGDEF)-like protein/PAS domain S-box-containing protein